MPTKTISIDAEAYKRLERARRDGESFSDTLKRIIWDPAPFEAMLLRTAANPLSDKAIAAVEKVAARNRPLSRKRQAG